VVAAHLDFHGITQWREADQFDWRSDQQAHFQQTTAMFGGNSNFGNGGGGANRQRGQRLSIGTHGSGHELFCWQRFDPNRLSQLRTDAESCVAHLTDNVVVLTKQFHPLFLAESHLAQTLCCFRRSGKLFDPAGHSHAQLGKRTDKKLLTTLRSVDG